MMMLLPMMMIHEVHVVVVVVVILQIIIRTGVIHTASSIVGVGVDDFYHSIICYIHEAKSRPDFLSFEVCMFYEEVLSAASSSSSYHSPSAVGGAHGPGFGCLVCMEEGGSFVILKLKVISISALVLCSDGQAIRCNNRIRLFSFDFVQAEGVFDGQTIP